MGVTDETGKQISRFRKKQKTKQKQKTKNEKQTYIFEFIIVSEVYKWSSRDSLLFWLPLKRPPCQTCMESKVLVSQKCQPVLIWQPRRA